MKKRQVIETVKQVGKIPSTFSNEFMEEYLTKECKHQTWKTGADLCTPMGAMLVLGLKSAIIDKSIVKKYLAYICRNQGYRRCIVNNEVNLIGIIDDIFRYTPYMPADSILKSILVLDAYYPSFVTLVNENKHFTMFS